jgi:hypothetical protein
LSPPAQTIMQRLGNIDCGAHGHDIIMSPAAGMRNLRRSTGSRFHL